MRWTVCALAAALLACGANGRGAREASAWAGIEKLIIALRSQDPRPAYALMTRELRRGVSYAEFAESWQANARERAERARALEESLRESRHLKERSSVVVGDGRTIHLRRERGAWRLESALLFRLQASEPLDAATLFAEALAQRDYSALLHLLSQRHREPIGEQVEAFVTSLTEHLRQTPQVSLLGEDRAELRWENSGRRYRIVLVKEAQEWRIDDVHILAAPSTPVEE